EASKERRMHSRRRHVFLGWTAAASVAGLATAYAAAGNQAPAPAGDDISIASDACTTAKLGSDVPVEKIGEPVRRITLAAPTWTAETATSRAYCRVEGVIEPVDTNATARPINFAVALPAKWSHRAVQLGGGGMNGTVPNLTGGAGPGTPSLLARGTATYGSDSGHQAGFGGFGPPGGGGGARPGLPGRLNGVPPGGPGRAAADGRPGGDAPAAAPRGRGPAPGSDDWALNEEAIANLGYMQMKKTHDAAFVIIERLYGARPRFNYYIGSSQGGREALTVAQRYPADYDGIAANVPIVGFSTLMLAPELIRIQEKPSANWITPAKVNAIRSEFMRQCDKLDGLADGIMNNYMACRAIFDVKQGAKNRHPWAAKRCPGNVDPNPADTSADACLTDGQISTLEFVYTRYPFAQPLANGQKSFGMWLPNTDPSGSGLIMGARFQGKEGAAAHPAMHRHLGALGVPGFLMNDLAANPLDYVEGGKWSARRAELSAWLDATNPDLSAFEKRGGKMIVAIGTNDTLASPGAQLDYYQAVLDKMGRSKVDSFGRLYVLPQTGHGLSGTIYGTDCDGKQIESKPIPNTFDRFALLVDWVENGKAPGKSITVTAGGRSLPMCSYPEYPKYKKGPVETAESYGCSAK